LRKGDPINPRSEHKEAAEKKEGGKVRRGEKKQGKINPALKKRSKVESLLTGKPDKRGQSQGKANIVHAAFYHLGRDTGKRSKKRETCTEKGGGSQVPKENRAANDGKRRSKTWREKGRRSGGG